MYRLLMKDFDSINEIEIKLHEAKENAENYRDENYNQYILMIAQDGMKYIVQDNYSLFDYSNITQKTTSIKETVKIVKDIESFELVNLNSISQTHGTKSLL